MMIMADKKASDDWDKIRRSNTRALMKLIRAKRIVVDLTKGEIQWPNGRPLFIERNACGYIRFKVHGKNRKHRWFFVHKAVYLAAGFPYRHDRVIDHINDDTECNGIGNLQLITQKENVGKQRKMEMEAAF